MTSKDGVPVSVIEKQVLDLLRSRHKVAPDDRRGIGNFNLENEYKKIQGLFTGIKLLMWIVGVGTLAAGAIGVSNIMLIIVRERTREIGIRRAVGATPWKVQRQILTESVILTLSAGLLGLCGGRGAAGARELAAARHRQLRRAADVPAAGRRPLGRHPGAHSFSSCRARWPGSPRRAVPSPSIQSSRCGPSDRARFAVVCEGFMKRFLGWAAGIVFAAIVIGTGVFLYKKSQTKPVVYQVVQPIRADIARKTVATGAVVPRKEVLVKPLIGGIIDELYVVAGQAIKEGDLIAKIRVIPNMVSLSSAEARVNRSKIAFADADREFKRSQTLAADGTIAAAELQKAEIVFLQAQEEQKAAQDNMDIVRKGTSQRLSSASTTIVRSTLSGMVLEVPLEVGNSVVESNNFNDGTTIAAIADMDDLIFEGKVDESEVGKIKVGMPLELTIGALPDKTIHAALEHIAPKGITENGAIQFEIRAAIAEDSELFIRANMSASADIVLEKKENVLSIDEALLQFEGDESYVEVETSPQVFERREIETGISDGMRIEVITGSPKRTRSRTRTPTLRSPSPATAQRPVEPAVAAASRAPSAPAAVRAAPADADGSPAAGSQGAALDQARESPNSKPSAKIAGPRSSAPTSRGPARGWRSMSPSASPGATEAPVSIGCESPRRSGADRRPRRGEPGELRRLDVPGKDLQRDCRRAPAGCG